MYTGLGLSIVDPTAMITSDTGDRCPGGTGTRCGAQQLPEIGVTVSPGDIFAMVPKVKDTTSYGPTAPGTVPFFNLETVPWPLVIGLALAAIVLLRKR